MSCEYRRKSDALLGRAAEATNLNERSRLIDEAIYWQSLAADAEAPVATDDVQKVLGALLDSASTDVPGDKPRRRPD